MSVKKIGKYIGKAIGIAAIFAVIALVFYIMFNHLGLIEELDFGAGAYYYADIPQFAKYVNAEHYHSQTPMWVLIALFLIWGYAMYRLWSWLDQKLK
ncbi:MAG: hypothetical protein ACI4F0_07750 [Agathobacter sp.]